jgi:hypothetical protein
MLSRSASAVAFAVAILAAASDAAAAEPIRPVRSCTSLGTLDLTAVSARVESAAETHQRRRLLPGQGLHQPSDALHGAAAAADVARQLPAARLRRLYLTSAMTGLRQAELIGHGAAGVRRARGRAGSQTASSTP